MNKPLAGALCCVLGASIAYADAPMMEIGGGAWMQNPDGPITYNSNSSQRGRDNLNNTQKSYAYAFAQARIPLPVIPNIRVAYSKIGGDGSPVAVWGSYTFTSGAVSQLTITQYDVTPFYNLVDNRWLTLDLGVDVRFFNVKYHITQTTIGVYNYTKSLTVPMGYIHARFTIPAINVSIGGDVKYISDKSSVISDMGVNLDYTFQSVPVVHPAIQVGYRQEKIKIDESSSDIHTNLTFSGAYAGLVLKF